MEPVHFKRLGIQKKQTVVLRLLKGEPVDSLADEYGRSQDELLELKRRFLQAGKEGLKARWNRK